MTKLLKINTLHIWITILAILALAYSPTLMAQSPATDPTTLPSEAPSLQDQPSTSTAETTPQNSVEKVVEDPSSLLDNEYIQKYGMPLLLGILVVVVLGIIVIILRKKIRQSKDLKHHTAQPFGHVSGHATKKAKKSNPESQVVAPGGASPAPQPKVELPEVAQEVINKKEMTIKESEPTPAAQPVPPQPEPVQNPAPAPEPPPQPPTQPQPTPLPQAQAQPAAQAPTPQPQNQPSDTPAQPAEDPNKPKIIVGDAIEDD